MTNHPCEYQENNDWHLKCVNHYETGKTAQVAVEMQNYNIALLGLSETRWP